MTELEIQNEIARIESWINEERRTGCRCITFEWRVKLQDLRHELSQIDYRRHTYRIMPKGTPLKPGDGFLHAHGEFVPFLARVGTPSDRAFLRPAE